MGRGTGGKNKHDILLPRVPHRYSKTKKQKVFGMVTSTGKSLVFLVEKPYDKFKWAEDLKKKVVPFLKKCFPNLSEYRILLDGEKLFTAAPAKKVMAENNVSLLPFWPGYSPDLNPQENVWAWAETELRRLETGKDKFPVFQKNCLKAVKAYPGAKKLVGSMAKRCQKILLSKGGSADKDG